MSARSAARALLALGTLLAQACTMGPAVPDEERFSELPDWRGVWFAEGLEPTISGFLPGFGLDQYKLLSPTAPWNETGRTRLAETLAAINAGKGEGWGYPMMMNGSAPLEFVITPRETLIVNSYRDLRRIYTDGRPLPTEEERWPTTWGSSVGRWEGDALIIETVSVRHPPRYFSFSPPFSERARYVERIRRTSADRLESQLTIEDPETLERPWALDVAYIRATGLDVLVHDAFDNDRSEVADGLFTIVPPQR